MVAGVVVVQTFGIKICNMDANMRDRQNSTSFKTETVDLLGNPRRSVGESAKVYVQKGKRRDEKKPSDDEKAKKTPKMIKTR